MRTSLDGGKETRNKPGPDVYQVNPSSVLRAAPRFMIGKSKRDGESAFRKSLPGPG